MREIPLTQGKIALVSEIDFYFVSKFKWHAHSSCTNGKSNRKPKFYARYNAREWGQNRQFRFYLHHFIIHLQDIIIPKGYVVDHINGDSLDNRRENLRVVTFHENSAPTFKNKKAVDPWL